MKSIQSNKKNIRTKKLDIEALDADFCGIAHMKGKTYRVRNTLPQERIETELPNLKNKDREKEYIYTPSRIISASPDRVDIPCPYANVCGNCNLLHCSYDAQKRIKVQRFDDDLKEAGIKADNFISSSQFEYRNKVHLAFSESGRQTVVGFFNEENHNVIPVKECLLHGEWFKKLAAILTKWASENHITAFKPWAQTGVLRFAVCRHFNNNIMVTIVARENIRFMDKLYSALDKAFDEVSLYLNINTQNNSKVFSDKFIFINGKRKLHGNILGIDFYLSPNSFFQVNEEIASEIYSAVLEKISSLNADRIVDAYSGIGITSLLFASRGYNVTSIEIVPKAVDDAKELAELNNLKDNIKFICGDCNNILPKLDVTENTVFFVDPPRKGLGKNVSESIIRFKPKHIIYLSCDPTSLGCDLMLLQKGGYSVQSTVLFDMFPNTKHVEGLVVLSKKE